MTETVRRAHPAMGTWFEAVLRGDDAEHLDAVASAAFDEVDRVERLLSRFDPGSEVSRVNREAAGRPVLVSHELMQILTACAHAWESSLGWFDVSVVTAGNPSRVPVLYDRIWFGPD
ncbi:MAG: FAD:protein FMN transferase, partial [Planctomycetia bacterium]|nr:FAD:protein FMN transferase [Planctomycetia bacterium]